MVEGLATIRSVFGPEETMNRFEAGVRANGMTVFCHIDHAAGAASAGLSLRPTDLLIFGTAKSGTPLMEANQTIAIDLTSRAQRGFPIISRHGWHSAMISERM